MTWDWEKLKQSHQQGEKKKPKRKKVPEWVFYTCYLICMIALAVALWFPVRWLHYKFAYEDKVRQQIIEMVNPEALKDKYKKGI